MRMFLGYGFVQANTSQLLRFSFKGGGGDKHPPLPPLNPCYHQATKGANLVSVMHYLSML